VQNVALNLCRNQFSHSLNLFWQPSQSPQFKSSAKTCYPIASVSIAAYRSSSWDRYRSIRDTLPLVRAFRSGAAADRADSLSATSRPDTNLSALCLYRFRVKSCRTLAASVGVLCHSRSTSTLRNHPARSRRRIVSRSPEGPMCRPDRKPLQLPWILLRSEP
jgi:hypothetical protein